MEERFGAWQPPVYRPWRGPRSGHSMTLLSAYWPRRQARALPPAQTLVVEAAPEVRLLAHCHWQPHRWQRPVVLLVHGLGGSSASGYMVGTAALAWQAGFSAVRMNLRGCGAGSELSVTPFHSGLSEDVARMLERVAEEAAAVFVVGFSLGANLALKMAAELGEQAPAKLLALAGVSPALDLEACCRALERPSNRFYQMYFVRSLKRSFRQRQRRFPHRYARISLAGIRTVWEFDQRVTAPVFGFASAEEYYHRASALRVLGGLRRPALLVAAADDPLVPLESLEREDLAHHRWLQRVITARGGHCGFLADGRDGTRFWAERTVVEFFRWCWRQARRSTQPDDRDGTD